VYITETPEQEREVKQASQAQAQAELRYAPRFWAKSAKICTLHCFLATFVWNVTCLGRARRRRASSRCVQLSLTRGCGPRASLRRTARRYCTAGICIYRHREGCLSLYFVYIYDIDTPLCKSHAVYTGRILQGGGGISGAVG
jgi:hypothetical protein